MPSSWIIDPAIGMALIFGATAALSSVVTELIVRFLGLRGAYLLRGLRELLDSKRASTDLDKAEESYDTVQGFIAGQRAAVAARAAAAAEPANQQLQDAALAAERAQVELAQPAERNPADASIPGSAVPSATGALLGSPILRSLGMAGQKLTLQPPSQPGRLPKLAAGSGRRPWRESRSLPSYIPAKLFAEAVVDLVVPDATGQTTMTTVRRHVDALPDSMTKLKPSLQALAKNAGNKIGKFRNSVERWYDDHMDRVSREYKRQSPRSLSSSEPSWCCCSTSTRSRSDAPSTVKAPSAPPRRRKHCVCADRKRAEVRGQSPGTACRHADRLAGPARDL